MSASSGAAEQQSIPLEGRLGDPAVLPRLFAWLARGDWSGMVVIRAGDVERRIYFLEGRVGTAGSSDPAESLSQALIREGLLTEEERSRTAGQLRVTDRGWSFGRQLVRAGLLQEKDLARVERRRVIQMVEGTLALRTGTYACESGTVAGDAQPQQALEVPRLVAEGVLTHWDANSALEVLGGRDAIVDLVVEHLPEHEATGAEEAYDYTLLLCDGRRSVGEILEIAPLPEAASLRFLAALRLLSIVQSRARPAAVAAPAREASTVEATPVVTPQAEEVREGGARAETATSEAAADGPVEIPARLREVARPAAEPERTAPAAAPAASAAPAPPARRPEPAAARPKPAPRASEPAEPAPSRIGWILVIIALLAAATIFFGWIGWKQFSRPAPSSGDLGALGAAASASEPPPVASAPSPEPLPVPAIPETTSPSGASDAATAPARSPAGAEPLPAEAPPASAPGGDAESGALPSPGGRP